VRHQRDTDTRHQRVLAASMTALCCRVSLAHWSTSSSQVDVSPTRADLSCEGLPMCKLRRSAQGVRVAAVLAKGTLICRLPLQSSFTCCWGVLFCCVLQLLFAGLHSINCLLFATETVSLSYRGCTTALAPLQVGSSRADRWVWTEHLGQLHSHARSFSLICPSGLSWHERLQTAFRVRQNK
jgi:hypothetical protein